MFDRLQSEIKECKLKSVDRNDKADYYRRQLEKERANREQADKQVIDLLHNVKDRYEIKLNSYMAKKGAKDKSQSSSAWGASSNQDEDPKKPDSPQGWSTETNNDGDDKNGETSWGDEADKNKQQSSSGWGSSPSKDENSNKPESPAWGTTTNDDDKKESDENHAQDAWGNEPAALDSGWGDAPTNNPSNDDSNATPAKTKETPTAKESAPKTTSNSKQDTNKNKKKNTPAKESNTETGKGDVSEKKGKPDQKKVDVEPKKVDVNQKKSEPDQKKGDGKECKECKDVKSQLWTMKLDLRLAERDKSKVAEEMAKLKAERDDLVRKLEKSSEEQDTLRVKTRGITVDLVAANEEINKLNERIDEIEAERKNKDRDVNLSESKRRTMENKHKMYQQQIAELQSELNSTKEEKEDYRRTNIELSRRNERLEADLVHSKNLIRTLKDGCALVEGQARTFEVRHDTVVMTKADLERELINIKEESSRHITTINKLQKSNEQISKAFIQSVEEHDKCKKEFDAIQKEYIRRLESFESENHKLVQANSQLRKLIDHLQKKR